MKCEKCGGTYTTKGMMVHSCRPAKRSVTKCYRVEVPTVGADVYYVDATSTAEAIKKVLGHGVEMDHSLDTEPVWEDIQAEEEGD